MIKYLAACMVACTVLGAAAMADDMSSPNYTGRSYGRSSTTGSYGTRDLAQGPHFTLPHYTPPHFDSNGNWHESHQSYGRYVDPYDHPSHRRSTYGGGYGYGYGYGGY